MSRDSQTNIFRLANIQIAHSRKGFRGSEEKVSFAQGFLISICRPTHLDIHRFAILHPFDSPRILDVSLNFILHHLASQRYCRSLFQDVEILAFYRRTAERRIHFHHLSEFWEKILSKYRHICQLNINLIRSVPPLNHRGSSHENNS